jgi:uncharacterized membrane protein (UPF0127 family)
MPQYLTAKNTLLTGCCVVLLAAACLMIYERTNNRAICQHLDTGSRCWRIETATTNQEQDRGLGGRSHLDQDQAMIFLFEQAGSHGFWMKDMHFPIDIIWLDDKKSIVHIEKSVSPDSYPTVFSSPTPARYVIEVAAGTSELLSWDIGTTLQF